MNSFALWQIFWQQFKPGESTVGRVRRLTQRLCMRIIPDVCPATSEIRNGKLVWTSQIPKLRNFFLYWSKHLIQKYINNSDFMHSNMQQQKHTSYRQSGAACHKLKKQSLLLTIKTTENFKEILHCSTEEGKEPREYYFVYS